MSSPIFDSRACIGILLTGTHAVVRTRLCNFVAAPSLLIAISYTPSFPLPWAFLPFLGRSFVASLTLGVYVFRQSLNTVAQLRSVESEHLGRRLTGAGRLEQLVTTCILDSEYTKG